MLGFSKLSKIFLNLKNENFHQKKKKPQLVYEHALLQINSNIFF